MPSTGPSTTEDRSDPKDGKREIDSIAVRRKLLSDPVCRVCELRASDPHHFLPRRGPWLGDDVEDNIAPLCHHDHMVFEYVIGGDQVETARAIAEASPECVAYVLRKLGDGRGRSFLDTYYHFEPQ